MRRLLGIDYKMWGCIPSHSPQSGVVSAILQQLLKRALLLLALASLAGCSGARLAYNNADTVVRWMAND